MGIKDLLKEIRKRHPDLIDEDIPLSIFRGLKLGLDVSVYSYKYMAVARKEAMRYIDPVNQDPDHSILRSYWLEKYFRLMMAFIESGITPLPFFDGPAFHLKQHTKQERAEGYEKRACEITEMREEIKSGKGTRQTKEKLRLKLANHVTFEQYDWDCLEEMFRKMGLPIQKFNYEAEAIAARFCREGITAGVVSNDGDCLAHWASIMIVDVTYKRRQGSADHRCTCIVLNNVLARLELSRVQFTDFCMMLGTDYNRRIKGYGYVYALRAIKKHGNLDDAIAFIGQKKDLSEFRLYDERVRDDIRGYFTDDFEYEIETPTVVLYEDGLKECFEEIFCGYNKKRMLELADNVTKELRAFNQEFARMQKFVLDTKSDNV